MSNYTLQDFLEKYYNSPISSIEIGIYLLSKLDDDESKRLLGDLKSINKSKKKEVTKLLTKVKCWLISKNIQ